MKITKTKLTSILLVLSMMLSSCGKSKNNSYDLNNYTITELVEILKDSHKLDEIFDNLKYVENEKEKTFEQLEKEYQIALKNNNETLENKLVYNMAKLLLSARISEISNINAKEVLNNIDINSSVTISRDANPNIKVDNKTFLINNIDNDEMNKLAINTENINLICKGYDRPSNSYAIYKALKRNILVSCTKKDTWKKNTYVINGTIDPDKVEVINKLTKK